MQNDSLTPGSLGKESAVREEIASLTAEVKALHKQLADLRQVESRTAEGPGNYQEQMLSIKDELASSYTLTYYPQNNPNASWRNIEVELVGDELKRYRIRTRNGYRPKLSD